VVRLLGEGGGDGPGILGVMHVRVNVQEETQQAVVTVRRMGGDSGTVSIGYQTVSDPAGGLAATGGQDYTQLEGRLTWEDGDATDQEIVVPIADDSIAEEEEQFVIALSDVQGGAGLGTFNATISITDIDQSLPPESGGGGGWLGCLSLWMLGGAGLLRSARLSVRSRLARRSG
jgi:hypothetical protein